MITDDRQLGQVTHEVRVWRGELVERSFAAIVLGALFTGGVAVLLRNKFGAHLSMAIGIVGIIATLYIMARYYLPTETVRYDGFVRGGVTVERFRFEVGFYLAITALVGYIVGGIMALRATTAGKNLN